MSGKAGERLIRWVITPIIFVFTFGIGMPVIFDFMFMGGGITRALLFGWLYP